MFANEACDQLSIRASRFVSAVEQTTDKDVVTDITSYFSRPRLLWRSFYQASSFRNLLFINLTNQYIKNTMSLYFNRTAGSFGYRATLCFRCQVAATPFMAGRLRFSFLPFNMNAIHKRLNYITPSSQLPGVEMDIAETTSMVIKIPFIQARTFFHVNSTSADELYGTLALQAFTALSVAPGVAEPAILVWSWMEDFELLGAAAPTVVPQMGKMTPSTAEAASINGNLSNVLAAGSNLATWAGSKIPLISSYAGPTSWLLRQAAMVAASYGWAKPIDAKPAHKVFPTSNTYQQNCDGVDSSHNMGMFAENAIVPLPGFAGTDLDEMSFDFLKGIYTVIAEPVLTTADGQDNPIYAAHVCPNAMFMGSLNNKNLSLDTSTALTGLGIWGSPIFGLANIFKTYRGGFKFKVKIAKTKFHSGRLLLGFQPLTPTLTVPTDILIPNPVTTGFYKSVIWDLREGNEMEFEVPYICAEPYLKNEIPFGSFFIVVLEPLVGPDTVASSAPIVVEVAGMPDLEFAIPESSNFSVAPVSTNYNIPTQREAPVILDALVEESPHTPTRPVSYAVQTVDSISSKSGSPSGDTPDIKELMPTDIKFQSGSFNPASPPVPSLPQYCIGEKLNSVKQLISRSCLYTGGKDKAINLRWIPSLATFSPAGPAPTENTQNDNSLLNYFSFWYGLYRGGVVYDAVSFGDNCSLTAVLNNNLERTSNNAAIVTENRGALHFKVPYYSRFTKSILGQTYTSNEMAAQLRVSNGADVNYTSVSVRAADDYQMGYFIGCPPLVRLFTNNDLVQTNFLDSTIQDRTFPA